MTPSPDIKQSIADEALKIVTGARRAAYGAPEQNFARIARLWNAHLVNRFADGFGGDTAIAVPSLTPGDVAAFMRLMKEARLAETPDHRDSYVDLVGYSLCGAEVAGVAMPDEAPRSVGKSPLLAMPYGAAGAQKLVVNWEYQSDEPPPRSVAVAQPEGIVAVDTEPPENVA